MNVVCTVLGISKDQIKWILIIYFSKSIIIQFNSSILQGGGSDSKPSAEVVVSWLVDHPDIDFVELSDSESELSSEFIPDSENDDDDFEDLEGDYEQVRFNPCHYFPKFLQELSLTEFQLR